MPRFAAIDVGSNAMRLLIVEAESARSVRELLSLRTSVRLGREVFLSGRLTAQAISAACEALREFRQHMTQHQVAHYRAVATSAVREAENGAILVERARREAGIELEIIEGVEEARLVRFALVGRLSLNHCQALCLDLGGGSTEISWLDRGEVRASYSLPVGTVRLLETFFKKNGHVGEHESVVLAREYIERQLLEVKSNIHPRHFDLTLGTGGNFETLATLCPAQPQINLESLHPTVHVGSLQNIFPKLAALTIEERRTFYNLRPDRADIIVPAAEIVLCIARVFGLERILAPNIGLKEGVIDELVEKHFDVWDLSSETHVSVAAALRLGRRYHFDEAHGQLVAQFAVSLFDQLQTLHRLQERDRLLLHISALLHDVGDFIHYEGHHRHSYYLLIHSDIMGISVNERTLVANIARYHRKSPPDVSHASFRELDREARKRVRALAAILRVADALDREHVGKITEVKVYLEPNRVMLRLLGAQERSLEEWTMNHKSELFREVFGIPIVLEKKE